MKLFTQINHMLIHRAASTYSGDPLKMTRPQVEDLLRTGNPDDMPALRNLLRAMKWDEGYSRANDPWGIWRTVHVGDEFPRVPLVELSRRRRKVIQDALDSGKTVSEAVLAEYPEIARGLASPVQDKKGTLLLFGDEEKIGDSSDFSRLMDAVSSGRLLVHARRIGSIGEAENLKHGLDPEWGPTLSSTEASRTAEEFDITPAPLVFASQDTKWLGGKRNALVFVDSSNFQKSLGDGRVQLPDGKVVSYERSPVAEYDNPALKSEPFGVEKGDWYSKNTVDVVAVYLVELPTKSASAPAKISNTKTKLFTQIDCRLTKSAEGNLPPEPGAGDVKSAAAAKGYKFGPAYHGTDAAFNIFSLDYFGKTDDGYYGVGFYFFTDAESAREYGSRVVTAYLKIENPLRLPDSGSMGHSSMIEARNILAKLYDRPELAADLSIPDGYMMYETDVNNYRTGDPEHVFYVGPKPDMEDSGNAIYGDMERSPERAALAFNDRLKVDRIRIEQNLDMDEVPNLPNVNGWLPSMLKSFGRKGLLQVARSKGYDAVLIMDADRGDVGEIVIDDPAQIKSTAPVTYDDQKNPIPLEKRFDSSNPDMRY